MNRYDLDPVMRCRLLAALVAELYGEDDPQPTRAAAQALATSAILIWWRWRWRPVPTLARTAGAAGGLFQV